jgi:hypothetical protein
MAFALKEAEKLLADFRTGSIVAFQSFPLFTVHSQTDIAG